MLFSMQLAYYYMYVSLAQICVLSSDRFHSLYCVIAVTDLCRFFSRSCHHECYIRLISEGREIAVTQIKIMYQNEKTHLLELFVINIFTA